MPRVVIAKIRISLVGAKPVRGARGFSLLELMVVLVILALMISITPALLSSVGITTELRGAARQLVAALRSLSSTPSSQNDGNQRNPTPSPHLHWA